MILERILVVLLATLVIATELTRISLYGTVIGGSEQVDLGHIELNRDKAKALFLSSRVSSIEGASFCIGTKDVPHSDCFVVADSLDDKQFVVQLDSKGEIDHLTVVPGTEKSHVIVKKAVVSPPPVMKPDNLAKNSQREKEVKKTIQTQVDEDGNAVEVEVEVEEDNRAWIQKNWMYVVPPLLILFTMMGEEEKPKAQ